MKIRMFRIVLLLALVAASFHAAVPGTVLADNHDEGSWDGGTGIGGEDGGNGGGEPPAEGDCPEPLIRPCRPGGIKLLQPLDDETRELPVSSEPLETFFLYFNLSWPWLLGVASGIAVLQAVWGGVMIMTSMDRDGGKEKIEWALGGMVMIALAGFILRFLNPIFYA